MPGIVRVEHRRHPYVVIDRRPLEDERLSWAARGLLGYLLAKPDDWQLRVSDLCRRGDLGRDGVHRLLQQLQDLGYLRRKQVRDARGRVAGYDYTVLEVPDAPGSGSPSPAAPDPADPDTAGPEPGEPDTGEPEPVNPHLPSNQVTKDPVDQVTTTTTRGGDGRAPERGTGARFRARRRGDGDKRDRDVGAQRMHHVDDRAGTSAALEYPGALSARETAAAERQLAGLPVELAQEILDELAGRMASGGIRSSPLSYLRALAARAQAGAFTPEVAVTVAAAREHRRRSESALEQATRPPELPPADPNHPLVQRVLQIRDRTREAARRGEPDDEP